MKFYSLALLAFLFLSCKENQAPQPKTEVPKAQIKAVTSDSAIVVSAHKEASRIGIEILQKGGNAFDAMIATQMALAVTYPNAGNLGGGGFMVYRTEYGEIGTLDFREKAPMASTRDMYLDKDGNFIPEKSTEGGLAVGVPGTVAGMFATHEKLGTLPIEIILTPVIDLANNGYVISEKQKERFDKFRETFRRINGNESIFTEQYETGDTLRNPALANTILLR